MIDLHMHTTCSDGQFSPEETMRMAHEAGVTVAAVTDHDTASGISRARAAAVQYGMTSFSVIDISVQGEKELHILGYGIQPENAALQAFCKRHAADRRERCGKMLEYLHRHGVQITLDDVRRCNDGKTSGRPHFARTLVELGYASSVQGAYEKYLTTPEYSAEEARPKPTPEEGIGVIQNAGGVAVLAHPHQLKLENDAMEAMVVRLKAAGLQGIEAYYSTHSPEEMAWYAAVAVQQGLFCTCGSDFHGEIIKPDIALGTGRNNRLCLPDELECQILERFQAALSK